MSDADNEGDPEDTVDHMNRRTRDKFCDMRVCDMDDEEKEEFLSAISERGAFAALKKLGLHDPDAISDIKDLRSLLAGFRVIKKNARTTALSTFGKIIGWVVVLVFVSLTVHNSPTVKNLMIKLLSE